MLHVQPVSSYSFIREGAKNTLREGVRFRAAFPPQIFGEKEAKIGYVRVFSRAAHSFIAWYSQQSIPSNEAM